MLGSFVSRGHDHGSLDMRAAIIHVIGDFVQSTGVALAGVIIWVRPEWTIVDPICTFLFAALVLMTTKNVIRDIIDVMMERAPRHVDVSQIKQVLTSIKGVRRLHDLHIWAIKPGVAVMSVHVHAEEGAELLEVTRAVAVAARQKGLDHSTVQIVGAGDSCPCEELLKGKVLSDQTAAVDVELLAGGGDNDTYNKTLDQDHSHGHIHHDQVIALPPPVEPDGHAHPHLHDDGPHGLNCSGHHHHSEACDHHHRH
ncbi:hypothetical protein CEUSTIGMA_g11543.t1 [Chlamydomonas eustigma]|uniref:Cation efflux protein cytoplasmic domain-containing protein n=1 Tax=Chlamydomonas eustigma TaxID=1157962 RepID=A0A250XMU9_9CHLO|nr:hypothetical protein CEUSTIGMA_g11543.t1 [Chlamydomonas eustigma]|eukprot:GAX84120.1 hypothetical protein CEUSTIGMA_g11543.t1 [Chlamydomonas eustigma]